MWLNALSYYCVVSDEESILLYLCKVHLIVSFTMIMQYLIVTEQLDSGLSFLLL